MIKPEQIPDEALEAAARSIAAIENGDDSIWDAYIGCAEYAIAAAINAWPGMSMERESHKAKWSSVLLPLPQEKNDD